MARPSSFTQLLADEICERIAMGESMVKICESDHMPSRMTISNWQSENPSFYTECARARELQADYFAHQIYEEAMASDKDNASAQKVKTSALQWLASKMSPKQYGDKVTNELTGANGGAIEITKVVREVVRTAD